MSILPAPAMATNPWLSQPVEIRDITAEAPGVDTYHLAFQDAARAASYCFEPGQFNMLYLPGVGEVPISLSADPAARGTWAHTIRVAGNTTRALAQLGRGGSLGLRGPYGTSWPLAECRGADVILVAGGIGLAPLRSAIYRLLAERRHYGQLTLLYGARSPMALLYVREYADWARRGLLIETTVDRSAPGWLGNVGVVGLLLERMRLPSVANCVLMLCGPEVMMKYTVRSALERGFTLQQIDCSLERNMQCAVGLCGHCQLGPEFLCKDGPIFRYDRVAGYLAVEAL